MSGDGERVGTVEREGVAAVLVDAATAGYLDTDEFTERSASAFAARTSGELSVLIADLPETWVRARSSAQRRQRHAAAARRGIRVHVAAYLVSAVSMIAIWVAVGLATGAWYPWPIWPILGWGLGLAGHVVPVRLAVTRMLARH